LVVPKIEKGEIPPQIKEFFRRLSQRNPMSARTAATVENDIEKLVGLGNYWRQVESLAEQRHNETRAQIARLWITTLDQSIGSTVDMVAIQALFFALGSLTSAESDATKRQELRKEIASVFDEVKSISDDLKKVQPPLDLRKWQ
jgi:hypothetical protein